METSSIHVFSRQRQLDLFFFEKNWPSSKDDGEHTKKTPWKPWEENQSKKWEHKKSNNILIQSTFNEETLTKKGGV